jgi:chemotaxis family two-component system response regulator Rcp1
MDTVKILLVEDNLADARLVQFALEKCKIKSSLYETRDGVEALSFLRRQERFAQAPTPDLILLDLNLPRMDGREFLENLRADSNLSHLIVAVLTTSEGEKDIMKCFQLHANCYLTKTSDLSSFIDLIDKLLFFWCNVSKRPPARLY